MKNCLANGVNDLNWQDSEVDLQLRVWKGEEEILSATKMCLKKHNVNQHGSTLCKLQSKNSDKEIT